MTLFSWVGKNTSNRMYLKKGQCFDKEEVSSGPSGGKRFHYFSIPQITLYHLYHKSLYITFYPHSHLISMAISQFLVKVILIIFFIMCNIVDNTATENIVNTFLSCTVFCLEVVIDLDLFVHLHI